MVHRNNGLNLVFRENAKTRQNQGVFEGAVMEVDSLLRLIFRMNGNLQIQGKYLSLKTKKLLIFTFLDILKNSTERCL